MLDNILKRDNMKTKKTGIRKPLKIELEITELELIDLLRSLGYSIDPDYSMTDISYNSDYATVSISLIDCSQL